MVLEGLGKSLRDGIRRIAKAGYVDRNTLDEVIKDIQRAMLSADVNVKLVFGMTENIKSRAWDEKPPEGLSKREHILNIVYEEITAALGGKVEAKELGKVSRIMLVGLFGSGKTTTCGKLALHLKKQGLKVALISTDTWRPAAYEQLKQIGEEIDVPVFGNPKEKSALKVLKASLKEAKSFDIIIVDSAGRDTVDKELSKELKKLDKEFKAEEKLLVIPADLGQKAEPVAKGFNELIGIDGVILTKLDSTAKGGGALSACSALNVPIKFVGIGERSEDFEAFKPDKFVGKLLGMGDLESLMKKTQEIFGEVEEDQVQAMLKGDFNLKDLYKQIEGMKKMGPLKKVMEMMPMGADIPTDQMDMSQERMNSFMVIMDSMTNSELEDSDLLDKSRVERIATGAGTSVENVRTLLKQYKMTKKMMKRFGKNQGSLKKMMKNFKGFPGM